jgi:hypothetical protein
MIVIGNHNGRGIAMKWWHILLVQFVNWATPDTATVFVIVEDHAAPDVDDCDQAFLDWIEGVFDQAAEDDRCPMHGDDREACQKHQDQARFADWN